MIKSVSSKSLSSIRNFGYTALLSVKFYASACFLDLGISHSLCLEKGFLEFHMTFCFTSLEKPFLIDPYKVKHYCSVSSTEV